MSVSTGVPVTVHGHGFRSRRRVRVTVSQFTSSRYGTVTVRSQASVSVRLQSEFGSVVGQFGCFTVSGQASVSVGQFSSVRFRCQFERASVSTSARHVRSAVGSRRSVSVGVGYGCSVGTVVGQYMMIIAAYDKRLTL